jgi:putative flippase GtrA
MILDPFAGEDAQIRAPAGMSGVPGPLFRLVRDQRVAFLIVGLMNTVIGTGWFVLLFSLFGDVVGYLGALVCAHIASVLCAFVLYRTFVFRVTGHLLRDLVRFEFVNLSVLAFNAAALPLLVQVVGWPVVLSQLVIVGVAVVYSWFAHRGFSFHRSPADLGLAKQRQA